MWWTAGGDFAFVQPCGQMRSARRLTYCCRLLRCPANSGFQIEVAKRLTHKRYLRLRVAGADDGVSRRNPRGVEGVTPMGIGARHKPPAIIDDGDFGERHRFVE